MFSLFLSICLTSNKTESEAAKISEKAVLTQHISFFLGFIARWVLIFFNFKFLMNAVALYLNMSVCPSMIFGASLFMDVVILAMCLYRLWAEEDDSPDQVRNAFKVFIHISSIF